MSAARLGLLVLMAVAATVQGAAAQTEVSEYDRFQLFNNCEPMYLVVEPLPDEAADIGLTEQRLQFAVESRLRGARLYNSTRGTPFLYVEVKVAGAAFSLSLVYVKQTVDVVERRELPYGNVVAELHWNSRTRS